MTPSGRKPRTDSVTEMTRIMQGAKKEVAPPGHVRLGDQDWPFWESVVAEFARADWTEHQLELAAMLARTMSDLEENQRLMREEGVIVEREILDGNGEVKKIIKVENVRARAVQTMMAQVLAMRRSLALHAKGQSGSNRDAGKQRNANKATEAAAKTQDDLLA